MHLWIWCGLLAALLSAPLGAVEIPPPDPAVESTDSAQSPEIVADPLALEPIVVTATLMQDPYTAILDPRRPLLPQPGHDGASYLDSITGFTQSRKGGTSGDPLLRGLGGSRLNILADDAIVLGGCDARMDPPTAYIYPEAYDRVEILKGPQSVRDGPSMAGVVRFERDQPSFDTPGLTGYLSSTLGSFERRDVVGEASAGAAQGYARFTGTWSSQGDFDDGSGKPVHSRYERWSASAVLAWTPGPDTRIEFILDRSDAEAAYDDRMMDGVAFDRTGYTLRFVRRELAPWLSEIEAVLYHSAVDHVMDNFSLRDPPMMRAISYPGRRTEGGRVSGEFHPGSGWNLSAGLDWNHGRQRSNILRGPDVALYASVPPKDSAAFTDWGTFIEASHDLGERGRVTFGLREDRSRGKALSASGFGGAAAGDSLRSSQHSGFVRYRHDLQHIPLELFAGLGRTERTPDYWERERVFGLDNEVLTQLDLGARYVTERLTATLALFHGRFEDFILTSAPDLEPNEARNIDATTRGGEMDLRYRLNDRISLTATAAWVRSDNDDDARPLAQTPPAEGTFGIDYDGERWLCGALLRAVARQDRIHRGHGTIYSLDTVPTPSYETASLYAGWRLNHDWTLVAGIDNLFDAYYKQHIQRGSAELGAAMRPIAEPGRSAWLRFGGRW